MRERFNFPFPRMSEEFFANLVTQKWKTRSWRKRLADLSWFNKELIARRANLEDACHLWEALWGRRAP